MIVETTLGKIEGTAKEGCEQYLGIPYAAPPVGELRFRPPAEAKPWEGIRDCKKYGHAAPQLFVPGLTRFRGEGETPLSEDCLYLNVTTPEANEKKRPVLFWIHGGAFQKGSATLGIDELSFAKEGMVVVSCNYRLGVFGYMDLSEYLGEEYKTMANNGLLDILKALEWTRRNIAKFGGDPENVTIAGQSACAKTVGLLTCCKKATGLFTRAVLLSVGVECLRDRKTAQAVGRQFMNDAALTKENAKELLTMPWEEIVERQKKIFAGLNLHTVGAVFDGENFEGRNALDIVLNKTGNNVPLMILTNRDEIDLYWHVYGFRELDETTAERLFGDYGKLVKSDIEEKLAGLDNESEEYHRAFVFRTTEYIYRAGAVQFAAAAADAGQPVYVCRNDWEKDNCDSSGTKYLACHGSESQFLFDSGSVKAPSSPEHDLQARLMREAVMNFMKEGRPYAEGLPVWPRFTSGSRQMMVFNGEGHVERSELPQTDPLMPHQVIWMHRQKED